MTKYAHIKVCGKVHKPRPLTCDAACGDQRKKFVIVKYLVFFTLTEKIVYCPRINRMHPEKIGVKHGSTLKHGVKSLMWDKIFHLINNIIINAYFLLSCFGEFYPKVQQKDVKISIIHVEKVW